MGDRVGISADEFAAQLWSAGVRAWESSGQRIRMVTHRTITREDVTYAAQVVARACAGDLAPTERGADSADYEARS